MTAFLADESVQRLVVDVLRSAGHDVTYVAEFASGADDPDVLDRANADRRILITNDKDFAELMFLQRKLAHGIVLLRMNREPTARRAQRLLEVLSGASPSLENAMTVVELTATRRRSPSDSRGS